MTYRNDARVAQKRARIELDSGDDRRIKYAALELREAMESLTYDRSAAYKEELPPIVYETWQPRKVMELLLEVDPSADKDSSLAFGLQETPGVAATVMRSLGSEKVLNLKQLKKHYDALGSFLHVPTLKQSLAGPIDHAKRRERCEQISKYIEGVLASPIWNSTLGTFAEVECENCGETIRKRLPRGTEQLSAECFGCHATYTVTDAGPDKTYWQLNMVDVECANPNCCEVIHILHHEFKEGSTWTCKECGGRNLIALGVAFTPLMKSEQPL
jgi:hypothetical protein